MKLISLFFILLLGIYSPVQAETNFFNFISNDTKEKPVAPEIAKKITDTLKKLPEEGQYFNKIEMIEGIRAMNDEIVSAGEVKILVNLDWQALPSHPEQRKALDNASARIIHAVFSEHNDITKLRVIVRIKNNKDKYRSVAKVFSFTRATWELSQKDPRYQLSNATNMANFLSLGDYVVLTNKGWVRGY